MSIKLLIILASIYLAYSFDNDECTVCKDEVTTNIGILLLNYD